MIHELELTDGGFATIDLADLNAIHTVEFTGGLVWTGRISDHLWRAVRKPHTTYVVTMLKSTIELRLHRAVMDAKLGQDIDHIDHNGLNNTRTNLRFATPTENNANRRASVTKAGFKGVSHNRNTGKYEGYIRIDKRKRHLGLFETAEDAARAYDTAALEAWGEYACLNFTRQLESVGAP